MLVFPIISICLVIISILTIRNQTAGVEVVPRAAALVMNGALLLYLVTYILLFMQNKGVVSDVPASFYGLLMIVGLFLTLFSFRRGYAPGHFTAAAIHCFVGFAAIFTIGALFFALAIIELGITIYQFYGRRKKKLA